VEKRNPASTVLVKGVQGGKTPRREQANGEKRGAKLTQKKKVLKGKSKIGNYEPRFAPDKRHAQMELQEKQAEYDDEKEGVQVLLQSENGRTKNQLFGGKRGSWGRYRDHLGMIAIRRKLRPCRDGVMSGKKKGNFYGKKVKRGKRQQ